MSTGLRCCAEQPHREDNHNEMEAKKEADKERGAVGSVWHREGCHLTQLPA